MGKSLRDLARELQAEHEKAKKKQHATFRRAQLAKLEALDEGMDALAATQWYVRHGYKQDIRFERRSAQGASYLVRCLLCDATGMGASGSYEDVLRAGPPYGWQARCMNAHIYGCACGLYFVTMQQCGAHVAANRRWRNAGHGRLDQPAHDPIL